MLYRSHSLDGKLREKVLLSTSSSFSLIHNPNHLYLDYKMNVEHNIQWSLTCFSAYQRKDTHAEIKSMICFLTGVST
jgi:hypothetical protein